MPVTLMSRWMDYFVARPDRLLLVDTTSEALQVVFSYLGRYYGLRHSPSRAYYAYI
jgi:hypothetical protein